LEIKIPVNPEWIATHLPDKEVIPRTLEIADMIRISKQATNGLFQDFLEGSPVVVGQA
jgi:hypothetical protein